MQIVVREEHREFQVLKVIRSRPGGSQFGVGNLFNKHGLAQSGLFCGRELLLAFDVPNQESGFMGISGKYTRDAGYYYFGEHNENNKLNGRGIGISSSDHILIQYWNNGRIAPGNYLTILSDGDVDVGECYLKDGKKCDRGTTYKNDGTSEKFDY